jgi:peptidyl-prolyl cis-trans isomerase C
MRIRSDLGLWLKDGVLVAGILCLLAADRSGPTAKADPPVFIIGTEAITASQVRGILVVGKQDALVKDSERLKNWAEQYLDQMVVASASIEKGYMNRVDRRYALALYTLNVAANAYIEEAGIVTEDEVRAFYDANPSLFVRPEQRHAAHILVPDEAKAQEVIRSLAEEVKWEEAVKTYSTDASTKEKAGDLGWIRKGNINTALSEEAFRLEAGQSSAVPVQTEFGYHIVKVLETRPEGVVSYEDARSQIGDRLLLEKRRKYFQEHLPVVVKELREKMGARVNPEGLAAIASAEPSFEVPGVLSAMVNRARGESTRVRRGTREPVKPAKPVAPPALP